MASLGGGLLDFIGIVGLIGTPVTIIGTVVTIVQARKAGAAATKAEQYYNDAKALEKAIVLNSLCSIASRASARARKIENIGGARGIDCAKVAADLSEFCHETKTQCAAIAVKSADLLLEQAAQASRALRDAPPTGLQAAADELVSLVRKVEVALNEELALARLPKPK